MAFNLVSLARYPAPMRLCLFITALLLIWVPIAAPVYWLGSNPNWVAIVTMVLLYGEFIFLVKLWGKHVYKQPQIMRCYGLEKTRRNGKEFLIGLGIGTVAVLSLFGLQGWLGLLVWIRPELFLTQVILAGAVVAIATGFAEELFFRGWLLDELQRDYRPNITLWANSFVFALLHFIKPLPEILRVWPQFPGLLLLGIILTWAKQANRGRLGLPIGLHAGLVWGYYIINVGQLVQYSSQFPEWITGIDRNPLASVMGLLFLGIIAFWMGKLTKISA